MVSPLAALSPKNIIIRMPNWLGDLVMATPIIADVRAKYPKAHITAMCKHTLAPVLQFDPHLNAVYGFRKPNIWLHHRQHQEIIQTIGHGEYDLGIILTNHFSTAWWFWQGNVKNRIGYASGYRNCLLNMAVPLPETIETQHLVITYKMLLQPLGIPVSKTPPQLYINKEEQYAVSDLLNSLGVDPAKHVLVGINPGAAYGSAKCWLPHRFRAVTERLLEHPDYVVMYFGDAAGAPVVHEICQHFPERVINLAGKTTIRELMALIQKCHALLTNDSGPMHVAAALGTPLVALFGSTNDIKTPPYGQESSVIHKHVECSPCYLRSCPIDFRCMTGIKVNEVSEALDKAIQKGLKKK